MKKKTLYILSTVALLFCFFTVNSTDASASELDNIETTQASSYRKTTTRNYGTANYPASIRYQEITNNRLYEGTLWYVRSEPIQGGYRVTYSGTLYLNTNYWPTSSKVSK